MGFFSGGATSGENSQINQNRSYIYGQGSKLDQQAQDRGNAYYDQGQQKTQQADQAYTPLINGQGGYTPEQAAAIENKQGLSQAALTPQQAQAMTGNAWAGITSPDELTGNYLTAGDAAAIHGDQSGIKSGLDQVNAAVDPNSVDIFTQNTRLTPQMQDQIATDAARSATNVDHASMDANAERARSAGMDPLGVAGYTQRADRMAQQDAANSASSARVNAMQVAAGRENNILGANQTLAAQKANAANTNLGAQQKMEQNLSDRAQSMALNRQQTAEGNQATDFNQQQQANDVSTRAQNNIVAAELGGAQYIDTNQSGRATTVANQNQGQAAEGRQYLQNQIGGDNASAQTEQGIQSGVYGTTTGAANQNTQNQITANNRTSGFNQFLQSASGVAQAGAKAYVGSDRRIKENIVLLGQLNGLNIYEYSFIGKPAEERVVGVMAQEAYERFPEDVLVGGEDPSVEPWKVCYETLVPKLLAA